MRLIDRLVHKEIIGPWLFGVGLFTALIMAATYMGRLAGFMADGVQGWLILQLTALYVPAILVKTFTMAVLLAALLAFGRLSSDSEIVALRAGGASVARIVRPVMVFSFVIAIVTFAFDETFVPRAAAKALDLTDKIVHQLNPHAAMPVARPIIENFKLRALVGAKNVNPASQALQGVTMTVFDDKGDSAFVMEAKELVYNGEADWRVRGGATIVYPDLTHRLGFITVPGDIWPTQMPKLGTSFKELISTGPQDFDAQSMSQLRARIVVAHQKRDMTPEQLANYEFNYWNKIALPLAALVFGTLGAVLGIRSHRTGTAAGFALAIAIIFGYVMLANFMNAWAMGGVIPAYVASFTPLVLGMVVALTIMWKRNG